MIEQLFEYLCSLDASFCKVVTGLEHARKRMSNRAGMMVVEPGRTAIARMLVAGSAPLASIAELPDREFEARLQSCPEAVMGLKAQMYANALTANEVKLYLWTKAQTVSDSLASIVGCLKSGSLISSLTLVRSCLEQIADVAVVDHESKILSDDFSDLKERQNAVLAFSEKMHKHFAATRIDWEHNLAGALSEGKRKSYKATDGWVDVQAESILNSVDLLDKRLKGSRKAYEFLCEFAHPNVGSYLIWRVEKSIVNRKSAIPFVETCVGNQTPNRSIEGLSSQLTECYEILHKAVIDFENTCKQLNAVGRSLTSFSKTTAKIALKNYAPICSSEEPCFCLSGLAVGSCCGKQALNRR